MQDLSVVSLIEKIGGHLGLEVHIAPESFSLMADGNGHPVTNYMQKLILQSRAFDIYYLEKDFTVDKLLEYARLSPLPFITFDKDFKPVLIEKDKKEVCLYRFERNEWRASIGNLSEENICPLICKHDLYESTSDSNKIMVYVPMYAPSTSTITDDFPAPTPFRRLMQLLKAERKHIRYVYIYAILMGLFSLSLPLGVQAIIGMVSGGLVLRPVIVLSVLVIIGTLMSGMLQVMQLSIVESIQQRIFTRTAIDFAQRIPRIKLESLLRQYAPELINRFFDILAVQKVINKLLTEFVTALLQVLFGLMLLSFYHPFFVFFSILLLFVLLLIFFYTGKKGLSTSLAESKYKFKIAHWLTELARNLTTFKIAGNIQLPLTKVESLLVGYLNKRKSHFKVLMGQYTSIVIFKTVVTGGVLILGSTLVVNRQITVGQFVASEIVIITVLAAVEKMILQLDNVYDILTSVEKLGNVTDLPLEEEKDTIPYRSENNKGFTIECINLSYSFPTGEKALNNLNLTINSCESLALIGKEGSGRSTFLHLVSGMLRKFEGSISINGFSIRDLNSASYRDYIGDCLSEAQIFDGTILENITLNRSNVTGGWLKEVIEICELQNLINNLPNGLHTHLSANGEGFASTATKKIILARTLIKKPKLILFDDFFFNLENDFKERFLDIIFDRERFSWSIIASSHDLTFLSRSDQIAILQNGKLLEKGNLAQLRNSLSFKSIISTN